MKFSFFLVWKGVPGSSYTFSLPDHELAISLRSSGSYYWERYLKTIVWVLSMLITTEYVNYNNFFQRSELGVGEKMHSYTDVHIYIYMYSTYIHTYKENKLRAPDISHIILYCVVFIHTHIQVCLFYCALLYCSLQILLFVWQIEGLWQCFFMLICHHHFPTAFAHCMSLYHTLVISAMFRTFSLLLLYLFWWPQNKWWLFGSTINCAHIR